MNADAPASPTAVRPFAPWEWELAYRYLRAKRKEGGVALISLISFIGVGLAVATLIIVMSVMNGFRGELLDRILGFNPHLYVEGAALEGPGRDEIVARITRTPEVVRASPAVEDQAIVLGSGVVQPAIVRGLPRQSLLQTELVVKNIKQGSTEGFGQGEYGGDLVMIGSRMAEKLGLRAGDDITLVAPSGGATAFGTQPLRKTYIVGGVFETGMAEYDQAFVFMPMEQAQLFFGKEGVWDYIQVIVRDPDDLGRVKPAVAAAAGPGTAVKDWRQQIQAFFDALKIERTVMRLILMLIVLVAAMNIISGLVMLVLIKGRDIAVLRTMGASRGAILRVFFLSGAIVGGSGTLAGLLIGVLFCAFIRPIQHLLEGMTGQHLFDPAVYFLSSLPARIEWPEILFIVLWSFASACLATIFPARRASRLDPVEALRYE
ncbi:MAG: lipoprotein-releasing ABC transporter permease subunit [Caulobacteraceae bacterium]|nr:lipoprotein-releasing ABC transporter permease subunit [Caulobacteraceae bacterium]